MKASNSNAANTTGITRLLVTRFSAIGDVAMTVPVVKALAMAYPDMRIMVVSRPFAKAFYESLAENVEFHALNLKEPRYKGLLGMEHVYQDLRALNPDAMADLHDVLRTKYARLRMRMAGIPVSVIDKGRKGRKELVRLDGKVKTQQPTSFEKYKAVFNRLGLDFPLGDDKTPAVCLDTYCPGEKAAALIASVRAEGMKAVGIAPFAAHQGKIYPIEKMEQVIKLLTSAYPQLKILLFGGGSDKVVFDKWCEAFPNAVFASELCQNMREELAVMRHLNCMVSMDSGNMHLASLVGTPVVSIWGATHTLAGFYGWQQNTADIVEIEMACRPCSIYGSKPCARGDYACMNSISPEQVAEKIIRHLK